MSYSSYGYGGGNDYGGGNNSIVYVSIKLLTLTRSLLYPFLFSFFKTFVFA